MKPKRSTKRMQNMTWEEFEEWRKTPYTELDPKAFSDIRPTDGFISYYPDPIEQAAYDYFSRLLPRCIELAEPKPIEFAAAENTECTFDRFKDIFPNVTRQWRDDTLTV